MTYDTLNPFGEFNGYGPPLPKDIPGLKITKGYRLQLRSSIEYHRNRRMPYNPSTQWKCGFPLAAYEWLVDRHGPMPTVVQWQYLDMGGWLFTGSTFKKVEESGEMLINIMFRSETEAMLFKLAWAGAF
jgi:hypothetical protein